MARRNRHQRVVVDLSVRILREAMQRSREGRVDTIAVRLALRCLLHHCRERWPLEMFWEAARQDHDIGRVQGCTASFNGIVRQLRIAGSYEDEPFEGQGNQPSTRANKRS